MVDVVAAFVGNNAWFGVFITIHVLGAVIGLGPTFAYAILGKRAETAGPEGGMALLEGIHAVENTLVNPILLTLQPLSGALMIWNRGLNHNFFSGSRLWLIGGILAYVMAVVIALGVQNPALGRMMRLGKSGQAQTPEFAAAAKTVKTFGPILTFLGFAIVLLMIWKPGSGCEYQC